MTQEVDVPGVGDSNFLMECHQICLMLLKRTSPVQKTGTSFPYGEISKASKERRHGGFDSGA